MRVLMIGDVVGAPGCNFVREKLPAFKRAEKIDVVIANGENSAVGNGVLPGSAGHLFDSGVDVLTGGLLEQLNNTSQVLGTNSNNINATVEDLSHSMKDCMDNITETFNASSQNINNKVDDIDTNLKVRLD